MKALRNITACSLLLSFGLAFGCGEAEKAEKRSGQTREVSLDKLPPLGEPLPRPLDDGRVTIAPPEGWEIAPRGGSWLIRFQKDAQEAYPSIMVYAEDDTTGLTTVTPQNAKDFAKQVAAELSQGTVLEPVSVGSFVGVNYELRGRAKHSGTTIVVYRALMETVVDGRRYKIDLRTRDDDLHQLRPYALAVAGGMEFHPQEDATPPLDAPPEEPAGGDPDVEFEEES